MKTGDMENYRFFLKDTIRQEVDFSQVGQHLGMSAPSLQKPCPPDTPRMALPDGATCLQELGTLPIGAAISQRESVRHFAASGFTLKELSMLLWATQGVRETIDATCALRTVPSAGARHSFETYLVVNRVESLAPGLYRYLPFDGALAQLRTDDTVGYDAAMACLGQGFVAAAAATFFWTTLPARMEWRYGQAAHKVIAVDAGHVCQNLYLACQSIGAGTCAIAAYDQDACDRLLGVDGTDEFTVYIAPVGKR